MAKIIKISYGNGAECGIRVEDIARVRAKYYEEKDPDTTYAEEFDFAMTDSYAAYDWMRNQMNGDEIVPYLFVIKPPREFDPIREMDADDTEFDSDFTYET